jgi:flagellin
VAFSTNTNIAALQAQEYLRVNSDFQQKTIGRVTSGLRITASGDDAAGLAIANGFRSDQAVLTQGIRNANDGLSQLQIIDGGINNISKLLDRARTLATQSASGTFTGSRTVLNNEFQSVLGEIDRQAQAIGLNTSGTFATSLSVFIGGGKASGGTTQITNGSVAVDLSTSTVDTKSLGLKGVQAKGIAGTDIGAGSATTSLSTIFANSLNTASQGAANTTKFTLRGPGFAGQGVTISVNTTGVGSTADLVAKINTAIEAEGNAGTQAATALKNAGIRASVTTDSSNRQQLTFSSSTTAFQVEAVDRTANALLGNFERNASITGSNTDVNVNTNTATTLAIKFDGASSATSVTLTDNGANGTTSKGEIVRQLNADSGFSALGVASLDGNQIVIKSKANSSTSAIEVQSGTLATRLGLSTTATSAAAASTGADVKTQVQGRSAVPNGANVQGTDTNARVTITAGSNAALDLTVGGTNAALTLTAGSNLTKAEIASDLNTQIAAGGLANKVTASVVDDKIVFTANNSGESITINAASNNAYTALGFTAGNSYTSNVFLTSDTIKVRVQGGGLDAPVDFDLAATTAGSTTVQSVLTDLISKVTNNSSLAAAGISLTTATQGNSLVFTGKGGEQFQVSVTGDTQNKLGFGSFALGSGNTFDYTTITAGAVLTPSFDPVAQTSTLQISLNGGASNGNSVQVTQLADRGVVTGGNASAVGASDGGNVIININGTDYTAAVANSASIATAVGNINTAIGANGTARIVTVGGNSRIQIETTQGANTVTISGASTAATILDLGLVANTTSTGNSVAAIRSDIVDQINTAIAGDAELRNAGLQASLTGGSSDTLKIESNNGTYFRLNTFGQKNLGFGNKGETFAGTLATAAPAVSGNFNSEGADASTALSFSDVAYGGDDQTVSITASNSSGAKQSLSVVLRNDATSRTGRTIDDAVKAINDALQQSNNTTLNRIVAVKENSAGSQKIRFLSTVSAFEVSISSTPGSTGLTPPAGSLDKSARLGTGANSAIDTQAAAESAVSALSSAVSALGDAQAVVGRGQNQLNFAVNLASSQLTNLAASESRIRDADLAAEAANLTKAQIVSQAGVAALAQANSAPQAVLALLRG